MPTATSASPASPNKPTSARPAKSALVSPPSPPPITDDPAALQSPVSTEPPLPEGVYTFALLPDKGAINVQALLDLVDQGLRSRFRTLHRSEFEGPDGDTVARNVRAKLVTMKAEEMEYRKAPKKEEEEVVAEAPKKKEGAKPVAAAKKDKKGAKAEDIPVAVTSEEEAARRKGKLRDRSPGAKEATGKLLPLNDEPLDGPDLYVLLVEFSPQLLACLNPSVNLVLHICLEALTQPPSLQFQAATAYTTLSVPTKNIVKDLKAPFDVFDRIAKRVYELVSAQKAYESVFKDSQVTELHRAKFIDAEENSNWKQDVFGWMESILGTGELPPEEPRDENVRRINVIPFHDRIREGRQVLSSMLPQFLAPFLEQDANIARHDYVEWSGAIRNKYADAVVLSDALGKERTWRELLSLDEFTQLYNKYWETHPFVETRHIKQLNMLVVSMRKVGNYAGDICIKSKIGFGRYLQHMEDACPYILTEKQPGYIYASDDVLQYSQQIQVDGSMIMMKLSGIAVKETNLSLLELPGITARMEGPNVTLQAGNILVLLRYDVDKVRVQLTHTDMVIVSETADHVDVAFAQRTCSINSSGHMTTYGEEIIHQTEDGSIYKWNNTDWHLVSQTADGQPLRAIVQSFLPKGPVVTTREDGVKIIKEGNFQETTFPSGVVFCRSGSHLKVTLTGCPTVEFENDIIKICGQGFEFQRYADGAQLNLLGTTVRITSGGQITFEAFSQFHTYDMTNGFLSRAESPRPITSPTNVSLGKGPVAHLLNGVTPAVAMHEPLIMCLNLNKTAFTAMTPEEMAFTLKFMEPQNYKVFEQPNEEFTDIGITIPSGQADSWIIRKIRYTPPLSQPVEAQARADIDKYATRKLAQEEAANAYVSIDSRTQQDKDLAQELEKLVIDRYGGWEGANAANESVHSENEKSRKPSKLKLPPRASGTDSMRRPMLACIQLDPSVAKLLTTTETYDDYWATEEGMIAQEKIASVSGPTREAVSPSRRRYSSLNQSPIITDPPPVLETLAHKSGVTSSDEDDQSPPDHTPHQSEKLLRTGSVPSPQAQMSTRKHSKISQTTVTGSPRAQMITLPEYIYAGDAERGSEVDPKYLRTDAIYRKGLRPVSRQTSESVAIPVSAKDIPSNILAIYPTALRVPFVARNQKYRVSLQITNKGSESIRLRMILPPSLNGWAEATYTHNPIAPGITVKAELYLMPALISAANGLTSNAVADTVLLRTESQILHVPFECRIVDQPDEAMETSSASLKSYFSTMTTFPAMVSLDAHH